MLIRSFSLKKTLYLFIFCSTLISCKKEVVIKVTNYEYQSKKAALINVNIQKLIGKSDIVKIINTELSHYVCKTFFITISKNAETSIEDCAYQFNKNYTSFKTQFSDELFLEIPQYEAIVDGELSYQNNLLMSFVMSSSINTGSKQPITKVTFLNFDKLTGKLLYFNDLVSHKTDLLNIIKPYLEKELLSSSYKIEEFTKNNIIKTPDHFGYNELGIVAFYETPNNNFIEFSVPFDKVEAFLNY